MSEANFWHYLRPRLAPYGRLIRIENSTENGTPDVYYLLRGRPGWMELKFRAEPTRAATPITFDHLTMDQVNWLEDEAKHGGRASLFMQIGRRYVVVGPMHARPIYEKRMNLQMVRDAALYQSVNEIRPAELVRCLTRSITTSPF